MKLKKEHFIGIAGVVGIVYYVFFCKKGDDSTAIGEEPTSGGGGGGGGGGFPTGALMIDTPKPSTPVTTVTGGVQPTVITNPTVRGGTTTGPLTAADPRNNPIRTDVVGPFGNPVGTGTVGGGFIPFPKTTGGARPTTGRTGPVAAADPRNNPIVTGIKGVGGISGTGNNTGGIIPASQGGSPTPYTTGTKATSSTTVQGGNVFIPFAGKPPLTVHNLLM
jgi:hypothetical protein